MRDSVSPERQSLSERPQWRSLARHREQIERLHLRELFAADPSRGERLAAEAARHQIEWLWVPGHAGVEGNERADALANRGIDEMLSGAAG